MSARGPRPGAARPAGTGARTRTASPPGARPAGPCRSGPAPARPPWRPSAARATTTDAGSVGLDVAPPPGRRLLVGMVYPPASRLSTDRLMFFSSTQEASIDDVLATLGEHAGARDCVCDWAGPTVDDASVPWH